MSEELSERVLACVDSGLLFTSRARFDDGLHVIVLSGDLDLASRSAAVRACLSPGHVDIIVDLAGVVFMDCAGYGALIAARTVLERIGGSLTLTNPCGEPLRLLSLIGQGERSSGFFADDGCSSAPSVSAQLR